MSQKPIAAMSRRQLLTLIGLAGGSAATYQAMSSMGYASESTYRKPLELQGDPKGASVVVLGAGLAGLTAAMELHKAGYKVQVLEYNSRVGGRSWTIRGGDEFTELGGEKQRCEFTNGNYMNPGPWRISHKHRAILDYCRRLKVPVEPFVEVNTNAFLHSKSLFGGQPQRQNKIVPDLHGHIAELLARSSQQHQLDQSVTKEDAEMLREVLKSWAGLDKDLRYVKGSDSAKMRGYLSESLVDGQRIPGDPNTLSDVLKMSINSDFWGISNHSGYYDLQNALFQPVGGMDMIAKAFARELPSNSIRFNAKVVAVQQGEGGVTVRYQDTAAKNAVREAKADWCICTIPLSVLSQVDLQVGAPMRSAIDSVPYSSSVKTGLQFRRRFWEQDDGIYGGLSHTDLPIRTIGYPSYGLNTDGSGMLYGAFMFGSYSYEMSGMSAKERVRKAVEYGAQIHPQYRDEFENGVSVAWHRVPFSMGCFVQWSGEALKAHHQNLRAIDGRIGLAGEHLAAAVGGWQEGAILSALDLVERLHQRVLAH